MEGAGEKGLDLELTQGSWTEYKGQHLGLGEQGGPAEEHACAQGGKRVQLGAGVEK